jgi:hypothetical protein
MVHPPQSFKDLDKDIILVVLSILTSITENIIRGRASKFITCICLIIYLSLIRKVLEEVDWGKCRRGWLTEARQIDSGGRPHSDRSRRQRYRREECPSQYVPTNLLAADILTFGFPDGQEPGRATPQMADDSSASANGGPNTVPQNQLSEEIQRWLSPPDPSTNHSMGCQARHEGTAKWFFLGNTYRKWKSAGSLLWVHGKRMFVFLPLLLEC